MPSRKYSFLLHPLFLISIFILLFNDLYLKNAFHNTFTGKLSDFAGLFAFAVFLMALLPNKKHAVVLSCALFFCWWKSPLSEPIIYLLQNKWSLPVHRIVDSTDLIALLVLPFIYLLKPKPIPSASRTLIVYIIGFISFFAFCSTTMPLRMRYYTHGENEIHFSESFKTRLTQAEILVQLDPRKEGYSMDSVHYYPVNRNDEFYFKEGSDNDSTKKWVRLNIPNDTSIYVKKQDYPFFVIPKYILDEDTLYNLELTITPSGGNRKPNYVRLESFLSKRAFLYKDFYDSKRRKEYRKHFKKLIQG